MIKLQEIVSAVPPSQHSVVQIHNGNAREL